MARIPKALSATAAPGGGDVRHGGEAELLRALRHATGVVLGLAPEADEPDADRRPSAIAHRARAYRLAPGPGYRLASPRALAHAGGFAAAQALQHLVLGLQELPVPLHLLLQLVVLARELHDA